MVDVHVNRFWGWQLSPCPSRRCFLQVFWSGEEKWMVGRKGGKGQSHWTVSSATEMEEFRNLPSDPAKETENMTAVHFCVDKFLKQRLETASCWIYRQRTASWVLLDLGYSEHSAPCHWKHWLEVLPSCHWHGQQRSYLPPTFSTATQKLYK